MLRDIIVIGLLVVLLPSIAVADTGPDPWDRASIEATLEGNITTYKIINLTDPNWQNGLSIWWRSTIPCGTFSASGLSATFDRTGCTADFSVNPPYIAVFIENLNLHLLVYAEYPEEGRKHGYSTGLLFARDEDILKYASAKEGTNNPESFPEPLKKGDATPGAAVPAAPSPAPEGGIPWIPIGVGALALVGAAYWIRARLVGGDYGKSDEKKKNDAKSCDEELRAVYKAENALERAKEEFAIVEDIVDMRDNSQSTGYRVAGEREYERGGGNNEAVKLMEAVKDAEEDLAKAKEALNACRAGKKQKGPTPVSAPASYVKPEGVPEDPEAM